MQNIYIKQLFRYLVSQLQEEIDDAYNSHIGLRLGLMIGLLIVLAFIYLSMWLPLIGRLSNDVIYIFILNQTFKYYSS